MHIDTRKIDLRTRVILLTVFMTVLCAVVAFFTGLMTEFLVLFAVFTAGIAIYQLRAVRGKSVLRQQSGGDPPDEYDEDQTMTLPVIDQRPGPGEKLRHVDAMNDGTMRLVIHKRRTTRKGLPILTKRQDTWERFEIGFTPSHIVNARLVRKSSFEPVQGEEKILVMTRYHWWSHGPHQLMWAGAALLATVAMITVLVIAPPTDGSATTIWLSTVAWLISLGYVGWQYVLVWIPWYYTWLVITDRRVLEQYAPPLWFEGTPVQSVPTHRIISSNWHTQNGTINWIFDFEWLRLTPFGVVEADTAADRGDEWLEAGIKYVRHPEDINQIINGFGVKESLEADRDRDYGRQTAEGVAELRDLMRDFVQRDT